MLTTKLGLARKQFYSIMYKLMDAGLIERTRRRYRITSYGKIVYIALTRVENAINNYWRLSAIDLITNSADVAHLPAEEHQILVDKLIDNLEIRDMLVSKNRFDSDCRNTC
jgi:hypothetical protein